MLFYVDIYLQNNVYHENRLRDQTCN